MEKLYMLEGVENEGSWRQPIAYSHDIRKLKKMCFGAHAWSTGTDNPTNSPCVVRYTSDDDYPIFWIREVPFII